MTRETELDAISGTLCEGWVRNFGVGKDACQGVPSLFVAVFQKSVRFFFRMRFLTSRNGGVLISFLVDFFLRINRDRLIGWQGINREKTG